VFGIVLAVAGFAWFWFWRSNQFTGGDSEYWERDIDGGVWFRKRQMLSFALAQLTYRVGHEVGGWTPRLALNFTSCLGGALALVALWRLYAGHRGWGWSLLLAGTAGFTTIFYGHIEIYAAPAAAFLLHLLAIERSLQGRWPVSAVLATFALTMAFHLVILFALPALALVMVAEVRRRGLGWPQWARLLVGAGAFAAVWMAFSRLGHGYGFRDYNFTHPPSEMLRRPWLILHDPDWRLDAKFAFWNAGVAAVLGPVGLLTHGRQRRAVYLAAYLACFLVFSFVWRAQAGEADFDLFAFAWIVAVVAFAGYVWESRGRVLWVGLALGVNVGLFLVRPVVFSEFPRRGYGVIEIEGLEVAPEGRALLDERLTLRGSNRFIPAGAHEIAVHAPPGPTVRAAVNLKAGERLRYRYDGERLELIERPGERDVR